MFLRQSTSQIIRFGPFLDSTDGITPETGLTIAQADMQLSKDGAAFAQKNAAGNATHDADGFYSTTLDATDTATTGILKLQVTVSGSIPVWENFFVLSQDVYDQWQAGTVLPVNAIQVSGDATAADNLELQYDGTGLTGETFPAPQSQVGSLSTGSSAISIQAESYVLTTGTQSSGTFANTATIDGIYHEHTDTAGTLDLYYQFDVTGNGTGASITIDGRINSNNDSSIVYAYDWDGATWDVIGNIDGTNGSTDIELTADLLVRHTGTGANIGKVRIRFANTGLTSATLRVDRIITSYAVVSQSVGYASGRVWIDTNNGTAGTTSFVNGVADNKVDSLADALTIASNVGLAAFNIDPGSSITLASTTNNKCFFGHLWNLALGGQDIDDSHFESADVSGIGTGTAGGDTEFRTCEMDVCTLPPCHMIGCSWRDTITVGSAGDFLFQDCMSQVAGSGSPVLDMGVAIGATTVSFRRWSGGLTLNNMAAGDVVSVDMVSGGTITVNGTGGTVAIRGVCGPVTDNSGGSVTIIEVSVLNRDDIAAAVWSDATRELTGAANITSDGSAIGVTAGVVDSVTLTATATDLTNLPSIPANWLTAAGIAAGALNGKGDWNIGKTGYSISGTLNTLDDLAVVTVAEHDATQAAIGALNNIAATDIVTAGAITTLSGAVVNVDLVDVTTTNTDMRGTDGANTVTPDNAGIAANGVAIGNLNDISVAQILAGGDVDGFTLEESLKLLLAASTGVSTLR